jgi:ABC-2 type transport system permease protein
MAPLGLVRVIRTKYALTTLASLALTVSLVAVSCNMLRLPWDHTIFFSISVAVMSLTLNGLATGLGVLYPNFKEDNPGKIVSGFGGTFCLVLSFLYILASIVALAFGTPWARSGTQPLHILLASWFTFVLLSVGTGWVPFHLALRRVRAMEL